MWLAAQVVIDHRGPREVVTGVVQRTISSAPVSTRPGLLLSFSNSAGWSISASRPLEIPSGGVVAGDHDQEVEREQLELRYRLAVDRGVGEHRGEVVARVLAAVLGNLERKANASAETPADPRAYRPALELGVLDAEVLVGDLQHEVLVFPWNAEHLGDHAQRLARRDVDTKVAGVLAAVLGEVIEQVASDLHEALLEPVDGRVA